METINLILNVLELLTLFGGVFWAFRQYYLNKKGFKKDQANIILNEIRKAEQVLTKLKEEKDLVVNAIHSKILSKQSWNEQKHLFVDDFDSDEFSLIDKFYNDCEVIDASYEKLSTGKQIEHKSLIIQEQLGQMAMESTTKEEYQQRREKYATIFQEEPAVFVSDPIKDAILNKLNQVSFVTTSSAGTKLKAIAKK